MNLPTSKRWLNTLQLGLALSAAGWGISFWFTFASWESATNQMAQMGAGPILADPLMDYWLRMASAAFGCIGIASGIAAAQPAKYESLVRLLAPFHCFMAIVLASSAWMNRLNTDQHISFIPDIIFCSLTAILIQLPLWMTRREGKEA
jgi:hypothetical protein